MWSEPVPAGAAPTWPVIFLGARNGATGTLPGLVARQTREAALATAILPAPVDAETPPAFLLTPGTRA